MDVLEQIEGLIEQMIKEEDPEKVLACKEKLQKLMNDDMSAVRVLQEIQSAVCAYFGLSPRATGFALSASRSFSREKVEKALGQVGGVLPEVKHCFDVLKHRDLMWCLLQRLSSHDPVFQELKEVYRPKPSLWLTDMCSLRKLK